MNLTGRTIVLLGIALVVVGLVVGLGDKLPFRLGRLPGDLSFGGKNSRVYIPLGTSLVLSIVISLVAWLLRKL